MPSHQIELSAGTLEYEDSGGNGPIVVLLHGFIMDEKLWQPVVADLRADHRCVVPTLPLGAHRQPVRPEADLSMHGLVRLVDEFLQRLDLREVTLAGLDTGGALVQLLMCERPECVARAVLASCDAFDNFPPGLPGKAVVLFGKLPPALFGATFQLMRLRLGRRLPIAFGWMTKRGDRVSAEWMKPILRSAAIRRDAVRALRAAGATPNIMLDAAERLPRWDRPALVVWASEDRVMPPEHGRRLAQVLPQARLVEVADSYTLISLDQPAVFAAAIREFTHS